MSKPGDTGYIQGSLSNDTFGAKAGVISGNGAEAYIAGSKTKGAPPVGQVGVNVPIVNTDNTTMGISGQTNFGKGRKPDHQIQFGFHHRF